ncbi:RagB/SusD family nutrient uptake outer membrane protein [Flagellimonas sp.]|uniref:RagB/SusD family nutrient uptake outer membrane protein n=1 Tax=Flagellimonas sp. TaxID=2058762 RepID=UPI003B522CD3
MMKRNQLKLWLLSTFCVVFAISCTDLEIEETDSIIDESTATGGIFNGVEDPAASVDNLFNGMNRLGDQANFYALQEVATDEQLVPTRGTDWGDNGIWRTLHAHTWSPGHQYILNVWNNWNQTIFLASEVIDSRSSSSAEQVAQASFVRAFGMWVIMDMYGQVPFRQPDEGPEVNPVILSRTEAYDFILNDLDVAIAGLPSVAANDVANQSRGTKAAARFLKARVLLNSGVYSGSGAPDASALNEVVSLVDAIAAEGYALQDGYFDIFKEDADSETIFWLPTSVGNRIWNGAHYNTVAPDNTGGGWNGFSTLAEFYDMFEGNPTTNNVGDGQEERRGWVPDASNADETNLGFAYGFFIGQAYDAEGNALNDRPGNPLVFTKELPGLVGNNERTGVRIIKYHPVNGSFTNHEIIFRYADAHLMKAEAIMRGAGGGDATALVNELRALRGATPLGSVTEADMLAERGRELYVEAIRRTDMIRFGQFTRDWEFKNAESVGDDNKNLFPIPTNALLSNPNLVQNPGY